MKDKNTYIAFFLANDKMGAAVGARFVSLSQDECIYEYDVSPAHFNPGGILHGGALYSVMDSAQGMLMHYVLDKAFKTIVTGTSTIKYLAPVTQGTIRIRTIVTATEGRKVFVNSIATDSSGQEVAVLDEVWIGVPA